MIRVYVRHADCFSRTYMGEFFHDDLHGIINAFEDFGAHFPEDNVDIPSGRNVVGHFVCGGADKEPGVYFEIVLYDTEE